jgi:hypothetical protein
VASGSPHLLQPMMNRKRSEAGASLRPWSRRTPLRTKRLRQHNSRLAASGAGRLHAQECARTRYFTDLAALVVAEGVICPKTPDFRCKIIQRRLLSGDISFRYRDAFAHDLVKFRLSRFISPGEPTPCQHSCSRLTSTLETGHRRCCTRSCEHHLSSHEAFHGRRH